MIVSRVSWLTLVFVAWGCSPSAGNEPALRKPVPEEDEGRWPVPPPAEPTVATTDATALVGTWVSQSCGQRTYPREIVISDGGLFGARDLVSPCPPNVACVWSGIVDRSGTWVMKESTVIFTVDQGADNKAGQPFPAQIPFTSGALVEEGGCTYQKK